MRLVRFGTARSGAARHFGFALVLTLILPGVLWVTASGGGPALAAAASPQAPYTEPADVAAFRASVGGRITPVIVELKGEPTVLEKVAGERAGKFYSVDQLAQRSLELVARQDEFLSALYLRGVRALLKVADVPQIDGSIRHVEWRFTYLLNGFVLYVADDDIERLRQQPEVLSVEIPEPESFHLDRAIDYSLGTAMTIADRRLAVYGPTQELSPVGTPGHAETPGTTALDGFEGQDINLAVIDSGVDWRHPMFGGIGLNTPTPRVSGNAPSPSDNTKVIYYYALSSPGKLTDDFGHGTLVASCAAGFKVDGNTAPRALYGTGRDGTGIGPTLNGATMHGMAPQARILAYKVCGPSPNCVGDTALAMEDAASPFTLVSSGNAGSQPVAKPVADVINLSLGAASGSRTAATSRAANNAALNGTIVVASAGNSGGVATVGSPSVATLAISVAASLDPGSVSSADVLAPAQIPGEVAAGKTPAEGAASGPPEENGAASDANAVQPGERIGMKLFPVAGAGPILGGSVSAHYVFVDLRPAGSTAPATITNRIALVKFTGTFAAAANSLAPLNPAGILLITAVESATAVQVLNGIPTFTLSADNGNYLIDRMRTGDPGDGDNNVDVPHGTVSELPLRLSEAASAGAYRPAMAGFSSRGPYANPVSPYLTIKPDVTAPGVGIVGAATPDGIPDDTIGLGSPSGYTQANGTSFSGPITAGAMALIRQYVRNTLRLDATDLSDPNYRRKRFDTVTVARALLQNSATPLRDGFGTPQADGETGAAINDLGSGHINVAAALEGKAILVAPVALLKDADPVASGDQREFNPPVREPPTLDAQGNLEVLIPTYSFGAVPVVGVEGVLVKKAKVMLRDVARGQGAGTYNLSYQDNRNANHPGIAISFLAADATTPVSSVTVPAGGTAEFYVQAAVDGRRVLIPEFEFQWYVTATQTGSGRTLRMPFYYRAVPPVARNSAAPVLLAPTGVESPAADPACGTDTDGSYTLNFRYTVPSGGATPLGFRVQEATTIRQLFFDNADEVLVGGSNSRWTGTSGWSSQANPETGSIAYFVPDTANQNETLVLTNPVALPAGSSTLTFDTSQDTEEGFDFAHVEISINNGASYGRIGSFSGAYAGSRQFDMTGFAGNPVKILFRLTSDLVAPAPGWYVENIRLAADDFRTLKDEAAGAVSHAISGRLEGSRYYRVAGLFSTPSGTIAGPYSSTQCIKVDFPNVPPVADAGVDFEINEREDALLSGAGSRDPDGGPLSYAWQQTAGPAVVLNAADTATPNFTAPAVSADTALTFRLTVTDAEKASHADDVVVTVRNVNVPPVANAGEDFAVDEGATALLSGARSADADGEALTYDWTQIAGPAVALANADTATARFTAPAVASDTVLRFRLTVSDPAGAVASDDIAITVRDLGAPATSTPVEGNSRILGGAWSVLTVLLFGLLGVLRVRRRETFSGI